MVNGTANRPYVYRQLAPFCIRRVLAAAPAEQWARLERWLEASRAVERLETWTGVTYGWWRTEDLAEIGVAALVNLLALLGFAYALRALLSACYRAPRGFLDATTVVGLALLPFLTREGVYVYDYPQLFVFTLGLVVLRRESLPAYYPLLVVAAVSKETSALLVVVFVATQLRRMPPLRLLAHTLAQLSLFAAVTFVVRWRFRYNPGAMIEQHLLDHNLAWLLRPGTLVDAFVWLGVLVVIVAGWKQKPRFLRRASVVIWPLLAATLCFGWIDELRDYYEAYPVLLGLAAFTVARLSGSATLALDD